MTHRGVPVSQVIIENPVVNAPFEEPQRHFRFSDEGITNEITSERRPSSYFVPVPGPKKKGKRAQMVFDTQWTRDRIEPNRTINRIREQVAIWRQAGHPDVTRTTARQHAEPFRSHCGIVTGLMIKPARKRFPGRRDSR